MLIDQLDVDTYQKFYFFFLNQIEKLTKNIFTYIIFWQLFTYINFHVYI